MSLNFQPVPFPGSAIPQPDQLGLASFTDMQPFSPRAGIGYQDLLEYTVNYLTRKLYPFLVQVAPGGVWDQNIERMVGAVDDKFDAYSAYIAGQISDAISALADGYDPTDAFNFGFHLYAPAPNGVNDTAALQAVCDAAALTRGEVVLGVGTYKVTNLVLKQQFIQPIIRGHGSDYTMIKHIGSGSVIKFRGGSGALSGGGLHDLAVIGNDARTSNGVEFSGCGHVSARNVRVTNCVDAFLFSNAEGNDFTEFCVVENSSVDHVDKFLHYVTTNNVESFHGSGARGNNIVNPHPNSTGPVIGTNGIALPYNAPLDATVFFSNPAQWLYDYGNPTAGRHASHFGHISLEGRAGRTSSAPLVKGANKVLFEGTISWLGSGSDTLGRLYLMDKITYEGGFVGGEYKPVSSRVKLKNTPTVLVQNVLANGESGLISVRLVGPNYDRTYLLLASQSGYNPGGTVTQLSNPANLDSNNIGAPTFTWGDYGLYVTNPNFTNVISAFAKLTPLGGHDNTLVLAQDQA